MANMNHQITIESVIQALSLPFDFRGSNQNYTCPECGGKRKLNINFSKGVYNCPKCGFHGSAFDLWAYYRSIQAPDRQELCRLVAKDFHSYTGDGNVQQQPAPKKIEIREFQPAPEEVLDRTYSGFLGCLTLAEHHRENLIKRGLPEDVIEANEYVSAPTIGVKQLTHTLLSAGVRTEGVPGFYKNSQWSFVNYGPGFLIPVRSLDGKIHGLQLRTDSKTYRKRKAGKADPEALMRARGKLRSAKELRIKPRYLTVSSAGRPSGTKGFTKPHYNPGKGGRTVIITEGPLKADIISYFTGYAVIGVLGVNSTSYLPEMLGSLRKMGKNHILTAFDMDMYSNPHVLKALQKMNAMIAHFGFRYARADWRNSGQKGLDDYLAAVHRK